jgi:hypothetical protein
MRTILVLFAVLLVICGVDAKAYRPAYRAPVYRPAYKAPAYRPAYKAPVYRNPALYRPPAGYVPQVKRPIVTRQVVYRPLQPRANIVVSTYHPIRYSQSYSYWSVNPTFGYHVGGPALYYDQTYRIAYYYNAGASRTYFYDT